ncbi:MAG TPA: VWA domain-containing protein [Chitinophagaceae bacterium]|nr:VWA domain-containing protein [Chitinophagaceae bacterium]
METWLKNIEFAYPWILYGLIVIPLLIIWYVIKSNKQKPSILISTTKFLAKPKGIKSRFFHIPFMLRCFGLSFLIIALARPQHKFSNQFFEGQGIDIMLCLDVSGSMYRRDLLPNRLEASKEVAKNFVRERPGDRIGIVVFGNNGLTMCPLTTDNSALIEQINNITTTDLTGAGTVIGTGIATSINRLKDSKSKTKIIIFLSDGVNSGGAISPETSIELARVFNIKIYTIGLGSNNKINVTRRSPSRERNFEFDEQLLMRMAEITGGQYSHAGNGKDLKEAFENINHLEKSNIHISKITRVQEQFLPFLVIGFLFVFLEILLRYSVFRKFP